MPIGLLHASRVMAIALPLLALLPGNADAAADMRKVLRISMSDITSLDPQQGTDLYSTRVTTSIFEAMYEFEYLSTGSKVVPNTAEAMPVITNDGKTWTMRVKKGILFADDPVFKGKPRELVAADYVYSIKRSLDPNLRQGGDAALTDLIVGARPVVDAARKAGANFDYDARIEGLQATDRYTVVMHLAQPDYTLLERLAGLPAMAVAREAIEAAGPDVMSKPVGTGPYRLKEWRRASRVVLEANPNYRAVRFPENADAPQQELVRNMRGKTLPQIGRIEISIIEESQPEILAFTQGDLDFIALGGDDTKRVLENGQLRPDLAKRGIRHIRFGSPSVTFTYFNMMTPTSAPPISFSIGRGLVNTVLTSTLWPRQTATIASAVAMTTAGTMPARNSPPMDRLATNPRMIMLTHGGIVSAMIAVAAKRPVASFGSCRVLRTAGIRMPPTAATSASFDPEMPEKNAIAMTMIRLRPPRSRPNQRSRSSINRDDMPLTSMIRPASTKNGTASRTK